MLWKVLLKKRVLFSLLAGIFILILIHSLISNGSSRSEESELWWKQPAPCNHPNDIEQDMYTLLDKLHKLFDELKVTHFVCYGTLWGAIRYSKLLPFDRDIDICVVYDDELEKSSLQQHELIRQIKERLPELYILFDPNHNICNVYLNRAMGEVVFFRRHDVNTIVRAMSRFGGVDMTDSFPAKFVTNLKKTSLGRLTDLPAPDSSVMKYWYPDTYEREVKPSNCF